MSAPGAHVTAPPLEPSAVLYQVCALSVPIAAMNSGVKMPESRSCAASTDRGFASMYCKAAAIVPPSPVCAAT